MFDPLAFAERQKSAVPILNDVPVLSRKDLQRFETEMTLEQRLPERCVLDVLAGTAGRRPDSKAFTMLMTGAPDEQARSVTYLQFLGLERRAANLFVTGHEVLSSLARL